MRRTPALLVALAVPLVGSACGGDPTAVGGSTAASPQALAAAFIEHYGHDPVAVAPLTPTDWQMNGAELGVEMAFRAEDGDNTHVRVTSGRGTAPRDEGEDPCHYLECDDVSTDDTRATLIWEPGDPEEDPGVIVARGQRSDQYLVVYANGPLVTQKHDTRELTELGEAVAATATDTGAGLTTTRAYAEAGNAIPDGVWLDWYGQGNGSPKPEDYVEWR
ncbi:hypothetical protein [Nocardioides acrostichi]|uniref:Lipoprotein n=1 Tax=Nocardioides acrostichi TaxID=2784339 RepID=A0A930V2X0_9ACTN|nr:hypothetical protein [Nocardioides acrostichi]MBF4163690.1 hypothetical protein [Nocardioides acrostichi]